MPKENISFINIIGLLITIVSAIFLTIQIAPIFSPDLSGLPFAITGTDNALVYIIEVFLLGATIFFLSIGIALITKKWFLLIIGLLLSILVPIIFDLAGVFYF